VPGEPDVVFKDAGEWIALIKNVLQQPQLGNGTTLGARQAQKMVDVRQGVDPEAPQAFLHIPCCPIKRRPAMDAAESSRLQLIEAALPAFRPAIEIDDERWPVQHVLPRELGHALFLWAAHGVSGQRKAERCHSVITLSPDFPGMMDVIGDWMYHC
jgi:hypothetical protein